MGREYRKLEVSDLPMVLEMERAFRPNFICEENARRFLSNPMNWLFACAEGGQIIGFAYGYELNRLDAQGNMLYIHEVGVLEAHWRQGVATDILRSVGHACKARGICRFFLFTRKSNLAACALYEKLGGELSHPESDDDRTYFFQIG